MFDAFHVPDELWAKFVAGEVDHFEYDDARHRGTAVFGDGRREEFDTTATSEHRDAARLERQRKAIESGAIVVGRMECKATIRRTDWHGVISGRTS